MTEVPDAGDTDRSSELRWRKSRHSNPSGNCVEMAQLPTGEIAVRNSRHPDGPVLVYLRGEIAAFLAATSNGEFDETAAMNRPVQR